MSQNIYLRIFDLGIVLMELVQSCTESVMKKIEAVLVQLRIPARDDVLERWDHLMDSWRMSC